MENKRIDLISAKKNTDFYDGKHDISKLGAGDSFYIAKFLKKDHQELFDKIMDEANFKQMFNLNLSAISCSDGQPIPRLVTAQCDYLKATSAIYRMPGCNEKNIDTTPWTSTVDYVRKLASEEIKQNLNHCVLSLYRDENDSLAFHKDKLLDLSDNSLILSISFGATRPFLFSDGRNKQTILLRPGSLLAIGPRTNKMYMHSIPKISEPVGPRISLSLRSVDSYISISTNNSFEITKVKNFKQKTILL